MSLCIQHLGFEPDLKGSAILVKAPIIDANAGKIIKPDSYIREREIGTAVGLILAIGNNAFKGSDEKSAKHFSTFKCEVGDWIEYSIFERQPSSIRLKKSDNKPICYYINDERILNRIKEEDLKYYIEDLKI